MKVTHATPRAWLILAMNTLAFTVCFACWMMNGVLITYLIGNGLFDWSRTQMAILMATPVLTGSVMRLPAGLLTDRYGGRIVYFWLMLIAAAFLALTFFANSFIMFFGCALGFGLSGASFAVGIAYTSVWFPKQMQGTALGIFGAGNAGAAITTLLAPTLLNWLTNAGENLEGWRWLPVLYAISLLAIAVPFWLFTTTRIVDGGRHKTLAMQFRPLADIRVWRFGLYYFLVFGGFVALSQWLVPYYVLAYGMSLAMAGLFASIFSFPSGVIRAACGWITDQIGARASLYWTFALCCVFCFLLIFPEMWVRTPGEGLMARLPGVIVEVDEKELVVRSSRTGHLETYRLPPAQGRSMDEQSARRHFLPLPVVQSQMTWAGTLQSDGSYAPFRVGDSVVAKQLLARGTTTIFFQANVYIFTTLVLLLGLAMGLGKAAVYKHIPTYFPHDVGAVGGLVGVIGGLGGFVCPILFGILLDWTGVWTTSWMFLLALSLICLVWMHLVVRDIQHRKSPAVFHQAEHHPSTVGTPSPLPSGATP
jgi:NNP family nitrate/nitrite transporter-like MFS transporter